MIYMSTYEYHDLFDEEDAKDWKEYLDNFLKEEEKCQH